MPLLAPLIFLVILILTVVIHEYSHGRVADHLGDPTARLSGRLTLNPIPHIDPVGTILVPLFLILSGAGILIGWAKPVPFDPFNLKDPRRDAAIIAIAGPVSNLFLAVTSAILMRAFMLMQLPALDVIGAIFLNPFIRFNILIALFNLIPVAPLDGFKVIGGFLSDRQAEDWYSLERYGFIFLLLIIFPFIGSRSMLEILLFPAYSLLTGILLP